MLKLYLLGEPRAEYAGERLSFPIRKALAMLLYAANKGRASREELALLLWGGSGGGRSSNNLRNAVYLLRGMLPENFFADRRYVWVEGHATDLDEVSLLSDTGIDIEECLFEEPLCGLDGLGTAEFDEWLSFARESIRRGIADKLRERVGLCYERAMTDVLVKSLVALLRLDPFDEDSVLELMDAHYNAGCAAAAVSCFKSYQERLRSEIGISPSARAIGFFRKLAARGSDMSGEKRLGEFFCCREKEIGEILSFVSGDREETRFIFINGEAGVGKTALVRRAIELTSVESSDVFTANPCVVGEKFPYSSWSGIASQIKSRLAERGAAADRAAARLLSMVFYDFPEEGPADARQRMGPPPEPNPVNIAMALRTLIESVSGARRPIFVLEDLHWFDPQSLLLLRSFLSEISLPATVYLTSRPEAALSVIGMLYGIRPSARDRRDKILEIQLAPLSSEDTLRLCRAFLSDSVISHRGEEYFTKKSEGLPLLLVEMLRILQDNQDANCFAGLRGLIMSRLDNISPLQRGVMEILSVFGHCATPADIALAMGLHEEDLAAAIEDLLSRRLVFEAPEKRDGGRFSIDFSHSNVRECVYDSIPGIRKRELHSRAADGLNTRYSPHEWNPGLSAELRYHFTKAGRGLDVLRQHLREMGFHVTLNHVLFPLARDEVLLSCRLPFSGREETERRIDLVRGLIREMSAGGDCPELIVMEAWHLEIWGGYLINWGEYRAGMRLLGRALGIAGRRRAAEIRLHCLEHVGHYFLQTDNAPKLFQIGRKILRTAKSAGADPHIGLALRFIGMSKLIERDFAAAERIFTRSADVFEDLSHAGRDYTLNLLAPLCYIGEMRQWSGAPDAAMEIFTRCIDICSKIGLFWGRSHFHAHAADAALDKGDWDEAYRHIDAGTALFESSNGGHCGSLLYSMKAICDAKRGNSGGAADSLKKSNFLSAIGKRTWLAPHLMAKAWLAQMLENGVLYSKELSDCLKIPSYIIAKEAEELYRIIGAEARADFVRSRFIERRAV
ncbi:MAG: AAA family ATPase [Synergistaceae bacterium]|jgi:DNA-binding SARP family transcriptional activator/tetratricopeptide (TPR) repeat protein|nr:AAA family ATPase [Synergistaceae bacterium]